MVVTMIQRCYDEDCQYFCDDDDDDGGASALADHCNALMIHKLATAPFTTSKSQKCTVVQLPESIEVLKSTISALHCSMCGKYMFGRYMYSKYMYGKR